MLLSLIESLLKILLIVVPLLIGVAYLTLLERKVLGSIQIRKGPNVVGFFRSSAAPCRWFKAV
jgi:NADH-quinone oxidoreductase subunit H